MTAARPGPLIGKGLTSEVFAWENNHVLKLFFQWMPREKIEREFRVTRAICQSGFAAPAAHKLIEHEGRLGIVFECIEGISMLRALQNKPWRLAAGARELALLHARMHAFAAPAELPSQRQQIQGWIDAARDLTPHQLQAARDCLATCPDGAALCHGDFHPENVLYSPKGPIIIDWIAATRGDPIIDVARSSFLFRHAPVPDGAPIHLRLILNLFRSLLNRIYLQRYFQLRPGGLQQIDLYEPIQMAAHSAWRSLRVN